MPGFTDTLAHAAGMSHAADFKTFAFIGAYFASLYILWRWEDSLYFGNTTWALL